MHSFYYLEFSLGLGISTLLKLAGQQYTRSPSLLIAIPCKLALSKGKSASLMKF